MKMRMIVAIALMALVALPSGAREKSSEEVARKEVKKRAIKEARKEAKKLEKNDWMAVAGSLSLEKQIEESKIAAKEKDSYGDPKWIIAKHTAVGGSYSAAKLIALTRAKGELAGAIKSEITKGALSKLYSEDLGDKETGVIDSAAEKIIDKVTVKLQDMQTLIEIYREKENGDCEMQIQIATDYGSIRREVTTQLKKELTKQGNEAARLIEVR